MKSANSPRPQAPPILTASAAAPAQSGLRRALPFLLACALLACSISYFISHRSSARRAHLERAAQAVQQHDGPAAEREWLAALQLDPRDATVYELLGDYYTLRHNWPGGQWAYARLIALAPATPHARCRLAACALRQGDRKTAMEQSEEELKRDPDCVAALGLTTSLTAQMPFYEAKKQIERLRRLSQLDPDDVDVLHTFAEKLSDEAQYDEMRPLCLHVLQLRPNDVEAHNLLGYADLSRPDQVQGARDALGHFQASLAVTRSNPGAYFGLGRAYLRLNQTPAAIDALQEALRQRPNTLRMFYELSKAYRKAGLYAQAEAAQAKATAGERTESNIRQLVVRCVAYPKDPDYPIKLAQALQQNGEPEKALFYLEKARLLKPDDARIPALLTRMHIPLSSLPIAAKAARQAGAGGSMPPASVPAAGDPGAAGREPPATTNGG